jgi:hypothetical protein
MACQDSNTKFTFDEIIQGEDLDYMKSQTGISILKDFKDLDI